MSRLEKNPETSQGYFSSWIFLNEDKTGYFSTRIFLSQGKTCYFLRRGEQFSSQTGYCSRERWNIPTGHTYNHGYSKMRFLHLYPLLLLKFQGEGMLMRVATCWSPPRSHNLIMIKLPPPPSSFSSLPSSKSLKIWFSKDLSHLFHISWGGGDWERGREGGR